MAGMNEQRKDESGIVVGCLIVGLLFTVLIMGMAAVWLWRSSVVVQEQRAIRAEELARQAQVSAIVEEGQAIQQQEKADPETK